MKKGIVTMAMVMLFSASVVWAADEPVNVDIGIDNRNTSTNTNNNTNNNNSSASSGSSAASDASSAAASNSGVTYTNNTPRDHIVAAPGTLGNFANVAAPAEIEGWKSFACFNRLSKVWTLERMKNASSNTNWVFGKKGGFWNSLFSSSKNSSLDKPFDGEIDEKPIRLIDWNPEKVGYQSDESLGTFVCEGDYGKPSNESLADCLLRAKKETNTNRAFAYYRTRIDHATSGFSLGSGAAASQAMGGGPANDNLMGSLAIGGIIGTSYAIANVATDWMIIALNDGPIEPPNGVYVCGNEPAPPVVIEKPVVKESCNIEIYLERIRIAERKIAKCWRYCHDNMADRLDAAKGNMDAFICSGDIEYLLAAIEHYHMAELNHIHGYDISKYSDSDAILAEVEYGLASAMYAKDGSIDNFWKPSYSVKHEDKKTGRDKWVKLTNYEKKEILKIRRTLERYSKKLTLN